MFKKIIEKYMDKNFVRCVQCGSILDRQDMDIHLIYHLINKDKSASEYTESSRTNVGGVHTTNFSRSSSAEPKEMEELSFYCVYCKEKVYTKMYRIKTSDSGRRMAQGNCPICNGKINRILGKDN
jgi:hypothetical protein